MSRLSIIRPTIVPLPFLAPANATCCTLSVQTWYWVGTSTGVLYVFGNDSRSALRVLEAHPGSAVRWLHAIDNAAWKTDYVVSACSDQVLLWGVDKNIENASADLEPVHSFAIPDTVGIVHHKQYVYVITAAGEVYQLSAEPNDFTRQVTYKHTVLATFGERVRCACLASIQYELGEGETTGETSIVVGTSAGRVLSLVVNATAALQGVHVVLEGEEDEGAVTAVATDSDPGQAGTLAIAYASGTLALVGDAVQRVVLADYAASTLTRLPDGAGFLAVTTHGGAWILNPYTMEADAMPAAHWNPEWISHETPGLATSIGRGGQLVMWVGHRFREALSDNLRSFMEMGLVGEGEGEVCRICFVNPPELALVPCGHYCICNVCVGREGLRKNDLWYENGGLGVARVMTREALRRREDLVDELQPLACPVCRTSCLSAMPVFKCQ